MARKELLYEKEGSLAIITINRPEAMNAFTDALTTALGEALEDAEEDDKVRGVILTAVGDRAFSAGADVKNMGTTLGKPRQSMEEVLKGRLGRKETVTFLYNMDKITYAAINGLAAGGHGLGFPLACDFRIASEKARFSSIFVRRGLAQMEGVSWLLPRTVGMSKALELALSGDIIDAHEALRIGLVDKIVPHDKLMEATKEFAGRIAKGPAVAQTLIKREFRRGVLSHTFEQHLDFERYSQGLARQSEDHQEGVRAFLEKREPHYTGR